MKIKLELTREDIHELIYESFCNGGLEMLRWSGIKIDWDNPINSENRVKAKENLKDNKSVCFEDVLMEMMKIGGIYFYDFESDEDDIHFTYELAEKNIAECIEKDNGFIASEIMQIIPEYINADANTYSNVLQSLMYGEVVYG